MISSIFRVAGLGASLVFCVAIPAQETGRDEHHNIEVVVVTAVPIERTVEQLAQPTSVLDGDQLAKRQSTSIGESLAGELGVSATYFGPVASRPVIRGQYGERVLVLSNGLDSLDASALSEDHAVSTDTILAERVEVVRGPATLLYGSGAAGGLVNVIDSRIHEQPPEAATGGAVAIVGDTATTTRSAAGKIHFGNASFVGHADVFRRTTDDVEIPGFTESAAQRALEGIENSAQAGRIDNTDSETEGGALAASYIGDRGFIGLSVNRYDSVYGVPGHAHEDEPDEASVRIDLEQTRLDLRGAADIDGPFERVDLKFANNRYDHVELEGSEIGTVFENDASDLRIGLRHTPTGPFAGSVGMQYKSVDLVAIGDEAFVPPSRTKQLSLFAFEEWAPSERWVVQASGRIERQEITVPDAPSYQDTALGASLGAIVSLGGGLTLSANLALTERHPNSTELYANGPHVAAQRVERGSVDQGLGFLDKETSTNLDLTLRGKFDRLQLSVTGFFNDVDDYVFLAPTVQRVGEFQVFQYAQENSELYGAEAELLFDIIDAATDHLHVRVFADFVHAEREAAGEYLPRIPPLRYGLGLHYTRDRIDASVDVAVHDSQSKTAAFELPTERYTMLNAELSYRLESPAVLAFARGTNLTDDDARRHSSPLKDIAPLPGRSLAVGLRWDF